VSTPLLLQTLAPQHLFVFMTFILQRFHIEAPLSPSPSSAAAAGETLPSCDPRQFQLGLILEPPPFNVRFVARK